MNTALTQTTSHPSQRKLMRTISAVHKLARIYGFDATEALQKLDIVWSRVAVSVPDKPDYSGSSVWNDGVLATFIQESIHDPWEGTAFQGYVHMGASHKGKFGEMLVERFFAHRGHTVQRAPTSTCPYDRMIDDHKTEIKFSLAPKNNTKQHRLSSWDEGGVLPNRPNINHAAEGKDWDRFVFVCINGPSEEDWVIRWFSKADFVTYIHETQDSEMSCLFSPQQGGKSADNDDYMCLGVKAEKLISEPWVRKYETWGVCLSEKTHKKT